MWRMNADWKQTKYIQVSFRNVDRTKRIINASVYDSYKACIELYDSCLSSTSYTGLHKCYMNMASIFCTSPHWNLVWRELQSTKHFIHSTNGEQTLFITGNQRKYLKLTLIIWLQKWTLKISIHQTVFFMMEIKDVSQIFKKWLWFSDSEIKNISSHTKVIFFH